MKQLLVIGCGGHARGLIELIKITQIWQVIVIGLVGQPHEVGTSVSLHLNSTISSLDLF